MASVGSTGASCDIFHEAKAFHSLFSADVIRRRDPWKTINDLELALAEYIDSIGHQRLHGEIWPVAPAEYANTHYRHHAAQRPP